MTWLRHTVANALDELAAITEGLSVAIPQRHVSAAAWWATCVLDDLESWILDEPIQGSAQ